MSKPKKILVADDDQITREIIGAILTKAGHEVVFAVDGKAAVEMAASENPDLVFIDGLMPKMHGFLACKAIKELPLPPKVILLTGIYTKPSYKWEAKGAFNADDLLKKPATAEALSACIEKHLPDAIDSEGTCDADTLVDRIAAVDESGTLVDPPIEAADKASIVVDTPTGMTNESWALLGLPTEEAVPLPSVNSEAL